MDGPTENLNYKTIGNAIKTEIEGKLVNKNADK
jgi:hypothetical protein